MKTTRISTGLYKVQKGQRSFIVENVGHHNSDGHPQWNISEWKLNPVNGAMHRTEAFDACDTLAGCKVLIEGFTDE